MHRAFVILGALALFLMPAVALAHGGAEVSVRGEVRSDGPIEVEGEAFEPKERVTVALIRDGAEPQPLGSVVADEAGNFSSTLHVPATVAPGLYRLSAEGESSATAEVTVLAGAHGAAQQTAATAVHEPVSNDRPLSETIGLAVSTAAVGAAGLCLLVLSERRGRVRQSEGL